MMFRLVCINNHLTALLYHTAVKTKCCTQGLCLCVYPCILIYVFFLLTSAHCRYPARGEWGGQSHVNQSVASWRHRSVPLSSTQGKGGGGLGNKTSLVFFPFFQFFFMHPGKQLSAIQITCQSETVMKVHFAVEISLCLFTPSAAQCLIFFFSLSLYVGSLLMLYSLLFA